MEILVDPGQLGEVELGAESRPISRFSSSRRALINAGERSGSAIRTG